MHRVLNNVLFNNSNISLTMEKSVSFRLEPGQTPFSNLPCVYANTDLGNSPFLVSDSLHVALTFFLAESIRKAAAEFNNWEHEKIEFWFYMQDDCDYPIGNFVLSMHLVGEVFLVSGILVDSSMLSFNLIKECAVLLDILMQEEHIRDLSKCKFELDIRTFRI